MWVFIFYRLVEKTTSVRLENFIGLIIFCGLFVSKSLKHKRVLVEDKRTTWEKLRLTENTETLEAHFEKLLSDRQISFENSMETSIRGINCILSIWQGLRTEDTQTALNRYIKFTYYHSIICPDLYVKRVGLSFKDESNNHRFYNLLLHQFYKLHFGKASTFTPLEDFIKRRLVNDTFFDEGSSFYHYGVIDALLKLRLYANAKQSKTRFSKSFDEFLNRAELTASTIGNLNFGDRDGTTIAPWIKAKFPTVDPDLKIDTDKFMLASNISNIIMLRKQNWCELGTQGHVHDDFGHLTYKSFNAAILDPGIYKYSEEPFLAKKQFHNFPHDRKMPQIDFVRKFERKVPRNKYSDVDEASIKLHELGRNYRLTREFSTFDWEIDDYADCGSNQSTTISWRFFLDGGIVVENPKSEFGALINVGSTIQIKLHPDAIFRVCQSQYFPEYGQPKGCSVLLIRLAVNTQEAKKIKLLSVYFPRNEEVR